MHSSCLQNVTAVTSCRLFVKYRLSTSVWRAALAIHCSIDCSTLGGGDGVSAIVLFSCPRHMMAVVGTKSKQPQPGPRWRPFYRCFFQIAGYGKPRLLPVNQDFLCLWCTHGMALFWQLHTYNFYSSGSGFSLRCLRNRTLLTFCAHFVLFWDISLCRLCKR